MTKESSNFSAKKTKNKAGGPEKKKRNKMLTVVKTTMRNHIELSKIKLNQTTIRYIRHQKPICIESYEATKKSYSFKLCTRGGEAFQLDGHSALTPMELKNNPTESDLSPIRVIVIAFKKNVVVEALKAKYGVFYESIPWVSRLDENLLKNSLLQSLATWLILEFEKQDFPASTSWIHLEQALLEMFIVNMDRRHSVRTDETIVKRPWFNDLEHWINANLTDSIQMDDLEKIAGVSKRSIQKAFQEYRGCSPMQAVSHLRLLKAREMLLAKNKKVTVLDVAMTFGYLHPSRFASKYKKEFGENPSETLALHGKQPEN